jgi:putative hydrolase of the HAD superfamily
MLECESPASRLGVKPQETAFVGDRLKDDAEGALGAGLHSFWLDRKGTGKTVPAGIRIIHSLGELPEIILK